MAGGKCATCGMRRACGDSRASWVFFFVGLVATVSMRVIEPLRSVDPVYGKISWYVGVMGFFLFFVYKYRVLREKSRIIQKTGLKEKLASASGLSRDEYALLAEIVCSQDNWKERANFIVIFGLSAVALAVAVWFEMR